MQQIARAVSTLKSALLKSEPTVIKTELFGATVFIRRLTGDYLISYEEKMAETAKAGAAREASEQVIQIVIDALVQPDGTAIPDEFKPTAAELLSFNRTGWNFRILAQYSL